MKIDKDNYVKMFISNDNLCVCCGEQTPEGTMVCVNCEKGVKKE